MNTYTSDYLIGMGDGYRKCYEKMHHTLYELDNELIDLNNSAKTPEPETRKAEGPLKLQDVVVYYDRRICKETAGMVLQTGANWVVVLSSRGEVMMATSLPNCERIGHIYGISSGTTLLDAIARCYKKSKEANKK